MAEAGVPVDDTEKHGAPEPETFTPEQLEKIAALKALKAPPTEPPAPEQEQKSAEPPVEAAVAPAREQEAPRVIAYAAKSGFKTGGAPKQKA